MIIRKSRRMREVSEEEGRARPSIDSAWFYF